MRNAINRLGMPTHFGLAYDMWVPEAITNEDTGNDREKSRKDWLERLQTVAVDKDYSIAFERWKSGLKTLAATRAELTSVSRLLVGHGNPSGSEVGMTVQHTWGAPMIPASSLKGLLHHHLAAKYGPEPGNWKNHPLDENHPEPDRTHFQPAYWTNQSITHTPGQAIRTIFGAPAADSDDQEGWKGSDQVGAAKGSLQFLDAWWKPDETLRPFIADILNVHQRKYYGQAGERHWPNDFDAPIPVQFMTVRPSQTFLLAICGEESLARWALTELVEALAERGIGGKTTAGYGLLELQNGTIVRHVDVEASPILDELKKCIETETIPPDWSESCTQREILQFIESDMFPRLLELNAEQRKDASDALKKKFGGHKKLRENAMALIGRLISDV